MKMARRFVASLVVFLATAALGAGLGGRVDTVGTDATYPPYPPVSILSIGLALAASSLVTWVERCTSGGT